MNFDQKTHKRDMELKILGYQISIWFWSDAYGNSILAAYTGQSLRILTGANSFPYVLYQSEAKCR
jgi:hypothetical protein